MNYEIRTRVLECEFKNLKCNAEFDEIIKSKFGFTTKYESARLCIGRSLAEISPIQFSKYNGENVKTGIDGKILFGDEIDLWISLFILNESFNNNNVFEDLKKVIEMHWNRGSILLKADFLDLKEDADRMAGFLVEFLPKFDNIPKDLGSTIIPREIRLKVGSISQLTESGEGIDFCINGQGIAPHIALMGKIGSGKTTTGIQIAEELISKAGIPFIIIDPKGEFNKNGGHGKNIRKFRDNVNFIEIGSEPIPLEFLPKSDVSSFSINIATSALRDSFAITCNNTGEVQLNMLSSAIEKTIRISRNRDLSSIKDNYVKELENGKKPQDSIYSRLNELTKNNIFVPDMDSKEFFKQSWVLSLNKIPSDELKKITLLIFLDTYKNYILGLGESSVDGGFRELTNLLVIDEARRILSNKKYQSLIDLLRQGRSKGQVVMLLSQDPSDFDGHTEDFTTQLGTVISFACAQSEKGLKALRGAFGRKLMSNQFSDTMLGPGIAFCKLPNRDPENIICWDAQ